MTNSRHGRSPFVICHFVICHADEPQASPLLNCYPRSAPGIIDAANELNWNNSILPGTTKRTDLSSEGNAPTSPFFSIPVLGAGH
jgi:hypothetical protein